MKRPKGVQAINQPNTERRELLNALSRLGVHDHACLLYKSREEQFAAAIPFIKMGLERHEKCVYIADENSADTVLKALRAKGVDVESAVESGSLAIVTKVDTYLRGGGFDPDAMIAFLKEATESAVENGFTALRATGEMTWALGPEPGVERLIEYEAKLNDLIPNYNVLAICQYNSNRFDADTLLGVIRTHPTAIIGDVVGENPFYVSKEEAVNPQPGVALAHVLETIIQRTKAERTIRDQAEAIRKLSTPVLQVRDGLLAIPIIGQIDSYRARQLTEQMLERIRASRAKVVVLDITGVPIVDSAVANHLVQTVQAARLLGARVIVTGVSADNAQTLVRIGVDLSRLHTTGDLQSGIREANRLLGRGLGWVKKAA